jgi:hypothetical protein
MAWNFPSLRFKESVLSTESQEASMDHRLGFATMRLRSGLLA